MIGGSRFEEISIPAMRQDGHVNRQDRHKPSPAKAARVLLCGDVTVVRDALATFLNSVADIDVTSTTGNGMEAIVLAQRLQPDVVVTDLNLQGIPGMEMVRRLRGGDLEFAPQVVVFAITDTDQVISEVLHAGVSGILDKRAGPEDLISAVRLAARGQIMLSPKIALRLVTWFLEWQGLPDAVPAPAVQSLTPREREVMSLIARGLSAEEIAVELTIGVATARTHIYRVRCKLGARDRAQIVVFAYRSGLMPPTCWAGEDRTAVQRTLCRLPERGPQGTRVELQNFDGYRSRYSRELRPAMQRDD